MRSIYKIMATVQRPTRQTSMKDVEAEISRRMDGFGSNGAAPVKTVNVVDLSAEGEAKNSAGESVGFNPYDFGTDKWFKHGQETGVWVQGASAQIFLNNMNFNSMNNKDDRFKNATNFLRKFADMLQQFQNELVSMAAGGATPEQMKAFAKTVTATSGPLDLDKLKNAHEKEGAALEYGFGNMLFMLTNDSAHDIERKFLNEIPENGSNRSETGEKYLSAVAGGFQKRITEAKRDLDIKPPDPDSQRTDLVNERAKISTDMGPLIGKLPLEQQEEAWELLNSRLDGAEESSLDSDNTPEVPEYEAYNLVINMPERAAWHGRLADGIATVGSIAAGLATGGTALAAGAMVGGVVGGNAATNELLKGTPDTKTMNEYQRYFANEWA